MSIDPVIAIDHTSDAQPPAATPRGAPSPEFPAQPSAPATNLGDRPKQEIHDPAQATPSPEMPQDEVQVQQDGRDGKIVIRYLDGSGNLILQIPSAQVLGLARAVDQALAEQAKNQERAPSGARGN
jgi:hypothetical protein